jgi:hypothetical protein
MRRSKWIRWYVKCIVPTGIQIQRDPAIVLNIYTNADWAGCSDDHRSTDGFAIYLGPTLIPWSSRKQPMAPRSSTEVEYKALTNGMAEAIWILVFVEGAWHTSVHSSCFCGVIILEPHISAILVFMPVPSILKLIFTMSVRRLLWTFFMSILLRQVIRLLTYSLNQLHT